MIISITRNMFLTPRMMKDDSMRYIRHEKVFTVILETHKIIFTAILMKQFHGNYFNQERKFWVYTFH